MPRHKTKSLDLKEACIQEAFKIIEKSGVQGLSMRAVARELGVSHQAPYKHFDSREHILAAVIERIFDEFAEHLDKRAETDDPNSDLYEMGIQYLDYAKRFPLKYRLMFNTALPEPSKHKGMMDNAQRAFSILETRLSNMPLKPVSGGKAARLDAMFVWSSLHGLASLARSDVRETIHMSDKELKAAENRLFARLSAALEPK